MQKGWQGNKTTMIERGAKKKVERLKYIRPEKIKEAAQDVISANNAFSDARMMDKEPDTARVDRAYAYLNALIERAAKEGVG